MRAYDLPVPGIPHLYTHLPKTPRTEPGENDLHYCQRTTASGDCRLRPAGAERNRFGNAISGWPGRPYVSMGERPIEFTTSSFLRNSKIGLMISIIYITRFSSSFS